MRESEGSYPRRKFGIQTRMKENTVKLFCQPRQNNLTFMNIILHFIVRIVHIFLVPDNKKKNQHPHFLVYNSSMMQLRWLEVY